MRSKELVRSDQRSEKENTSFNPKKCYRSHLFFYRYLACLGWRLRLTVRGLISKTTGVTLTPSTIESKMKKIEINSRCESWTNGVRGGRLFMQIFLASKNNLSLFRNNSISYKEFFPGLLTIGLKLLNVSLTWFWSWSCCSWRTGRRTAIIWNYYIIFLKGQLIYQSFLCQRLILDIFLRHSMFLPFSTKSHHLKKKTQMPW